MNSDTAMVEPGLEEVGPGEAGPEAAGPDAPVWREEAASRPLLLLLAALAWLAVATAVISGWLVLDLRSPRGDWQREARVVIGAASLFELVLGGLAALMLRQWRAQRRLVRALAGQEAALLLARERTRAAQALNVQNRRFEAALSNMSQALALLDRDDRLLVANHRLGEMLGLEAAAMVPGTGFAALLRAAGGGWLPAGDIGLFAARVAGLRAAGCHDTIVLEPGVRDACGGLSVAMSYEPMDDGGWLLTCKNITARRRAEARIIHMAHHDALTGLPNRVLFHDHLEAALRRARDGQAAAVLCLDLDFFKNVNDSLGHHIGDELLRAVTARLRSELREGDLVARLGGDEFAFIQSDAAQPVAAEALAQRIIGLLGAPYEVAGHELVIGASIGIALVGADGTDADTLLRNADLALYQAKADGRGVARRFDRQMDAAVQERRALEMDLRRALEHDELRVHYQPLINVQTRAISGFEALLRWQHPGRGLVSPTEFVPLAEEIGLIVPIGEWVLRRACRDAVDWPDEVKVAVNLSPVQVGRAGLLEMVADALRDSGLRPGRLELEITEGAMLEDTVATLATLDALHRLGVRIAMDDFGTGYSSLSYLRRFPFDKVKIDRSFVEGLGQGGDCDAIVGAVTQLCGRLGMTTTAEGVETEAQMRLLTLGRCIEVQGFLFSQARPAHEAAALCRILPPMVAPAAA